MPALLVAALVVVPLAELFVLIQVGQIIGAGWTIALLLLVSVVGAALLRREGARTWRAFQRATTGGRLPAQEVADGALVLLGGALLLTPGFLTDVVGLLCVLPPTRAVARRALLSAAFRRLLGGSRRSSAWPRRWRGRSGSSRGGFGSSGASGRPNSSGRVVDGEIGD